MYKVLSLDYTSPSKPLLRNVASKMKLKLFFKSNTVRCTRKKLVIIYQQIIYGHLTVFIFLVYVASRVSKYIVRCHLCLAWMVPLLVEKLQRKTKEYTVWVLRVMNTKSLLTHRRNRDDNVCVLANRTDINVCVLAKRTDIQLFMWNCRWH